MKMAEIISIDTDKERAIKTALDLLSCGKPIAIPTETVYGLAADATDAKAITSIYTTKGRPQFNPLICHMASLDMAKTYAIFDPISEKLGRYFWPGALTIVLPLKTENDIHKLATAGLGSVGIRVPKGFSAELIETFGKPLAAPSANSSGKISPTRAQHVADDLGPKIELILDQGTCDVGVESTIVKVEDGKIYLLRPGGISVEDIQAAIGQPVLRLSEETNHKIEAPGMMTSHYAPNAKMRLNATSVQKNETLITFGQLAIDHIEHAKAVFNLSIDGDITEAAHNLFDMLILADKTGADMICVSPIPNHQLGEAINDRLMRAAAPRGDL